eukprot:CAMPEP_0198110830 /NCGR_PEP_ID=MMETSP1442-20131203/2834_1 /TAXON_ID= /ORGANISM="Craspedostauros australis, Strain CCMP3328" /LENGTH=74 /DNA_ID=CAMNT_0043767041 /DNA_START=405 /DNA_END=629 /DNA_ORIENTATION=+
MNAPQDSESSESTHTEEKKMVSFSRKVTMVCMPHMNDLSKADRLSIWYTRDELRAMKQTRPTPSYFSNVKDIAC